MIYTREISDYDALIINLTDFINENKILIQMEQIKDQLKQLKLNY